MKKIFYFISLMVVLTTTGCQSSQMTAHKAARETKLDLNAEVEAMQLPAGTLIPATLPTTIQDPILLKAWITLYNHTKSCELWDGSTLSGQQLAQYVVDNNVTITWNTDPAYGESSWVDRGETDKVFINPGLQVGNEDQMIRLVGTMAHEMFHRTTPFGQEADTLYEEYWAFYVGSCVSGRGQAGFHYYNPQSPDSLTLWFKAYNRSDYLDEFEMYPDNVVALSSK
jgi:hypothetical protein